MFARYHEEKKHFIVSGLRQASTFCQEFLTEEKGWRHATLDMYNLPYLKDLYDQGVKFYVLFKEPTKRLTSAFELIVPGAQDDGVFAGVLYYYINKCGAYDMHRYGFMNYCLSDRHFSWGNSIYGLFLESVGIETEKLMLHTDLQDDFFTRDSWGMDQLPLTLNNYILKYHNTPETLNEIDRVHFQNSFDDNVKKKRQIVRDQRLNQYITLFGGARGYPPFEGGSAPAHNKFYSLFDWMNDERNAYWGLGTISKKSDRCGTAKAILLGIIKNMTDKIEMKNLVHDMVKLWFPGGHQPNNGMAMAFPGDTMVSLVKFFHPCEDMLPEIYQNRDLWTYNLEKGWLEQ
jgi:hypothetical protein